MHILHLRGLGTYTYTHSNRCVHINSITASCVEPTMCCEYQEIQLLIDFNLTPKNHSRPIDVYTDRHKDEFIESYTQMKKARIGVNTDSKQRKVVDFFVNARSKVQQAASTVSVAERIQSMLETLEDSTDDVRIQYSRDLRTSRDSVGYTVPTSSVDLNNVDPTDAETLDLMNSVVLPMSRSTWNSDPMDYIPRCLYQEFSFTSPLYRNQVNTITTGEQCADASLIGLKIYMPCVALITLSIYHSFDPHKYKFLHDIRTKPYIPPEERRMYEKTTNQVTFEQSCIGVMIPAHVSDDMIGDDFVDYTFYCSYPCSAGVVKHLPLTETMIDSLIVLPTYHFLPKHMREMEWDELKRIRVRRASTHRPGMDRIFPLFPPNAKNPKPHSVNDETEKIENLSYSVNKTFPAFLADAINNRFVAYIDHPIDSPPSPNAEQSAVPTTEFLLPPSPLRTGLTTTTAMSKPIIKGKAPEPTKKPFIPPAQKSTAPVVKSGSSTVVAPIKTATTPALANKPIIKAPVPVAKSVAVIKSNVAATTPKTVPVPNASKKDVSVSTKPVGAPTKTNVISTASTPKVVPPKSLPTKPQASVQQKPASIKPAPVVTPKPPVIDEPDEPSDDEYEEATETTTSTNDDGDADDLESNVNYDDDYDEEEPVGATAPPPAPSKSASEQSVAIEDECSYDDEEAYDEEDDIASVSIGDEVQLPSISNAVDAPSQEMDIEEMNQVIYGDEPEEEEEPEDGTTSDVAIGSAQDEEEIGESPIQQSPDIEETQEEDSAEPAPESEPCTESPPNTQRKSLEDIDDVIEAFDNDEDVVADSNDEYDATTHLQSTLDDVVGLDEAPFDMESTPDEKSESKTSSSSSSAKPNKKSTKKPHASTNKTSTKPPSNNSSSSTKTSKPSSKENSKKRARDSSTAERDEQPSKRQAVENTKVEVPPSDESPEPEDTPIVADAVESSEQPAENEASDNGQSDSDSSSDDDSSDDYSSEGSSDESSSAETSDSDYEKDEDDSRSKSKKSSSSKVSLLERARAKQAQRKQAMAARNSKPTNNNKSRSKATQQNGVTKGAIAKSTPEPSAKKKKSETLFRAILNHIENEHAAPGTQFTHSMVNIPFRSEKDFGVTDPRRIGAIKQAARVVRRVELSIMSQEAKNVNVNLGEFTPNWDTLSKFALARRGGTMSQPILDAMRCGAFIASTLRMDPSRFIDVAEDGSIKDSVANEKDISNFTALCLRYGEKVFGFNMDFATVPSTKAPPEPAPIAQNANDLV